ncbi:hypothetical protein ROG8370_00869 [Roseovarius gaetbuli]|uniref:Uncharacterized protein n=1 Tax=Roseovarius gaetbuli TaxID=1356575 RepID=A0A1X6YKG2_9RHOB|nr:hypothetical protein ROG8370_00869 [Roseovarius gaetbuli]
MPQWSHWATPVTVLLALGGRFAFRTINEALHNSMVLEGTRYY